MRQRYLLMNAAGGIGDGGGSGNADDGAGTPPDNSGGDNSGNEFVGPAWAKEWEGVAEIESEILNDPSLKVFNSPTALLKSYVHAQKQLGKKGVMIPTENSPKEEWDQFYAKVGVPLEEQTYKEKLKFPEDNKLGEDFNNGFLKLAHENRVAPDKAAKMYEFFNTQVKTEAEKHAAQAAEKTQAELDALLGEMGAEAYNVKLTKATNFLKEHAGDEFLKFLGTTGLGKNAQVVKAFMNMADKLGKEASIPDGDSTFGMTKADIEKEINNIYANFDDPYHKVGHPDHKRRVEEVQAMFRKLEK